MPSFALILPAAGESRRFKDKHYKKPYAPLADRAVWLHAAEKFLARKDIVQSFIVVADEDVEAFRGKFAANLMIMGIEMVRGGKTRKESVANALAHVREDVEFVCVHDAARPVVSELWLDPLFAEAERTGAAILATPVTQTLKRVDRQKRVIETVSREGLWQAQTPQVFRRALLVEAHAKAAGDDATDDAMLVERLGHPVAVVPGSPLNIKITTREDLKIAAQLLKALPKPRLDRPAHPFADDQLWR